MNNIAIAFTFRYAEVKNTGCSEEQAFTVVGHEFLKRIKAMRIITSLGKYYSRKFFFHDGSTCTFKNGYWKFNSQSKNNNHA